MAYYDDWEGLSPAVYSAATKESNAGRQAYVLQKYSVQSFRCFITLVEPIHRGDDGPQI